MAGNGGQAREEQFLGALLGLAIGDALGRPVAGLSAREIAARHARVDSYIATEGVEADAVQGEITGITETVLCMVESVTTNHGMIEPENINARLGYLIDGPSRSWMSETLVTGVRQAAASGGLVGEDLTSEPELAVAIRGVPVGLLHAVGGYDAGAMAADATLAARLTHGGSMAAGVVRAVAEVVVVAARTRTLAAASSLTGDDLASEAIRTVLAAMATGDTFEDAVAAAISIGGATNELGALAGALAGVRSGASSIPQHLIDGLDARIYLTLAAPWFYRAALRRAGTVIDLRVVP